MKPKIQRFGLLTLSVALFYSCGGEAPPSRSEETAPEENFYTINPAEAGNISGKVTYEGEVPPAEEIDMSRSSPSGRKSAAWPNPDRSPALITDGFEHRIVSASLQSS